MASSSFPLAVVVVMAVSSLLAMESAAEPHIEMVVNNNHNHNNKNSSSTNDYCHFQITVRTSGFVFGSGTDSTLTFYLYDVAGRVASVTQDGSWGLFEQGHNDEINFDGPCIMRPCNLVVTTDGAGYAADWLMSWLEVVEISAAGVEGDVTFFNGRPGTDGNEGATWLGPGYSMQLQINNC